jgi:hypothetical protein
LTTTSISNDMFQSISDSIFRPVKETGEIVARPQRPAERKNSPSKENGNVNITQRSSSKHSSKSGKAVNPSDSTITAEERHKTSHYIKSLRDEVALKDAAIQALTAKIDRIEYESLRKAEDVAVSSSSSKSNGSKKQLTVSNYSNIISDNNGRKKVKVGTRGSVLTQGVLEAQADPIRTDAQLLAEKFLKVFQNPVNHIAYLSSKEFAKDLVIVCNAVGEILENEPRCVFLQSPVYVFGDIHGNLEDLHFFSDNLWKLGMDLTAGSFLFLGDYVDRGLSCLECVSYLFGLKLLFPHKIHLLRGNHETRDVNGWEEHYADRSFLFQCKQRFGVDVGEEVWEECNLAFDRLPLASVIDNEIFCVHGGIPRPVSAEEMADDLGEGAMVARQSGNKRGMNDQGMVTGGVPGGEVRNLLALPTVMSVMPPLDYETEWMKQMATDVLWSDPASEQMEQSGMIAEDGFGESPRGGGAVCFGSTAIDNFLANNNLSYIIRAHEAHAHGVSLSKSARVFTVFSTSKDHRQGERAMAGCILVDHDKIQVINRSHKYKNKYVHRRTSVSLENLSNEELEDRRKLGLVRFSMAMEDYMKTRGQTSYDSDEDGDAATSTHQPTF